MENVESTKTLHHVAIVPNPGIGHLFPLIEFAKQLVAHHKFAVTFIIPNDGSSMEFQKKHMDSLPNLISYSFLPPVSLEDLSEDVMIETRIELILTRSLPSLRDSLKAIMAESPYRLVALVVDIFATPAFDIARELNILPYICFPSSATTLSFFFHLSKLDATTSCEYRFLEDPIELPGCVPIHGRDLFSPLHDRTTKTYRAFVRMTERYHLAHGIMVNTSSELEPGPIATLKNGVVHKNPPVFPIGPLTRTESETKPNRSDCLTWLDDQPTRSVMFVSFGSGGTLSSQQLTELAFGLEKSGKKFLWVLKSPDEKSSNGAFFSVKGKNNPLDYLPRGFLERTKDSGRVVDSWAPQPHILAHDSVGGFLTHCGWNSTLESLSSGVPMIAWPLFAEQKMNAVFLSECLKVAFRVEGDGTGLVRRDEIAEKTRELMEGEEGKLMRKRVSELKKTTQMALGNEGSSTKSLHEVVRIWESHKN